MAKWPQFTKRKSKKSKQTAAPYMVVGIPSSSDKLTSRSFYIIANFQCKLLPTNSQRISVPNWNMCDTISLKVGIITKTNINGKGEESNIKRRLGKMEFEKTWEKNHQKGDTRRSFQGPD